MASWATWNEVNAKPLEHLLAGDYVPVVCSLAADSSGQIYNVNGDTLATCLAVEIHAAKYFSVTTVDGVLDDVNDPHTLHTYLDVEEAESLVRSGRAERRHAAEADGLPRCPARRRCASAYRQRRHARRALVRDFHQ